MSLLLSIFPLCSFQRLLTGPECFKAAGEAVAMETGNQSQGQVVLSTGLWGGKLLGHARTFRQAVINVNRGNRRCQKQGSLVN